MLQTTSCLSMFILFLVAGCADKAVVDEGTTCHESPAVMRCVESFDEEACAQGCVLCENLPNRLGSTFMKQWLDCAPAALAGFEPTELQSATVGRDGLAYAWEMRFQSADQSREGRLHYLQGQLWLEVPTVPDQPACPPIVLLDSEAIVPDAIAAFESAYGDRLAALGVQSIDELDLLFQQDCRASPGYPLTLVEYSYGQLVVDWHAWFGSIDSTGTIQEWRGPCQGTGVVRNSAAVSCEPLPR